MIMQSKKAFVDTFVCKVYFWLNAALFALLCAGRIKLLFQSAAVVFISLMAVLFLAALVFRSLERKNKEDAAKILACLFALTGTCGLSMHMPLQEKSLIWLLIYGLLVFFICPALLKEASRRVCSASALLGSIFALLVLLGSQLKQYGRLEFFYTRDLFEIARIFAYAAGEACLFTIILNMLFACALEKDNVTVPGVFRFKMLPLYTLLVFACWLPYFYVFFPGSLSPDSINEISQQLGLIPQSNNHPYIHQFFIGLCIRLGKGPDAGVWIYTLLQMLFMAMSFSLCALFLESRGLSRSLSLLVLGFLALFPVNALYSITMWKNVIHGGLCLDLMILLIALNTERADERFNRLLLPSLAVFFGFFFCIFVNNAFYSLLLGFPLYILCNRKNWKRLCVVFVLIIALVFGYNRYIYNILEIVPSSSGEVLSVPLQQIARVASQHPEELDSEEFQILDEVFYDVDSLGSRYRSYISDPVKDTDSFRADKYELDPARYMKCWARIGLRHPVTYLEAFLHLNYGYWYPDLSYWIVVQQLVPENVDTTQLSGRERMQLELSDAFKSISEDSPLSILFSLGLMPWLLLIAAVLLRLKGQGSLASPLYIVLILWIGTLASPVYCEYRYLYGLVLCVPLYLPLAFCLENKNK